MAATSWGLCHTMPSALTWSLCCCLHMMWGTYLNPAEPAACCCCCVCTQLQRLPATLVFYAPPHGLDAILSDVLEVLGPGRQAVVARELTKLHEELFR